MPSAPRRPVCGTSSPTTATPTETRCAAARTAGPAGRLGGLFEPGCVPVHGRQRLHGLRQLHLHRAGHDGRDLDRDRRGQRHRVDHAGRLPGTRRRRRDARRPGPELQRARQRHREQPDGRVERCAQARRGHLQLQRRVPLHACRLLLRQRRLRLHGRRGRIRAERYGGRSHSRRARGRGLRDLRRGQPRLPVQRCGAGGRSGTVGSGREATPAGITGDEMRALALPSATASLAGPHGLTAGSLKSAPGWTSTANADGSFKLSASNSALLGEGLTKTFPKPLPPISQGTGGGGQAPDPRRLEGLRVLPPLVPHQRDLRRPGDR